MNAFDLLGEADGSLVVTVADEGLTEVVFITAGDLIPRT